MQQKFTHCYARRSLMALLWLLLPCIYLHAQKSVQPGRNVTITNSHISLRDVFNVMEKQTGVLLAFGSLNTNQYVGVKFVSLPIEDALAEMLPPLGLTYEYMGGNRDKILIRSIVAERKKDTVMVMSVSGVVLDDKGMPLPGASVRLKGTAFGTATKDNGSFTLARAGEKDVLQVSYMGYVMAEMPLAGRTNVKVQLKPADNSLNETVVTAYGTSTQRALTGAITVVKGEQIQTLPNRSFDKSLQGLVPGLAVTNGNGQPGSAPSNFVLRGIATGGSINSGSTVRNPLIVIDGVPVSQDPTINIISVSDNSSAVSNPMAQINPSDIESISVLKDAAAIALYGSKASNGVILVTTKRGRAGKTIFNFRHQSDFSSRLNGDVKMLNQNEYLELLKEAYRNSNPGLSDAAILADIRSKFPVKIVAPSDTVFYPQSNWNDEFYRRTAVTMVNELSISGGNERSQFYLSMDYTKQNGIIKKSDYDRKGVRFNFENRPNDWFKFGLNTMFSYNNQNYVADGNIYSVDVISPLNPIYQQDGKYFYNYNWGLGNARRLTPNPIAALDLNINKNTAFRGLGKLYGELKISRALSIYSSLGFDYIFNENKEKVHPNLAVSGTLDYGGTFKTDGFRTANIITTNIIKFNKVLKGDNSLDFLLGQEAQIKANWNSSISVSGFANNPSLDQILGGVYIDGASTIIDRQTLLSYFGQLGYSFRNKYFLSASARTDGASNFGANERFGTYWSVGGGWILSEEPFIRDFKPYLNLIKIRGSFGPAGNSSAIADYFRYDYMNLIRYLGESAVKPDVDRNPGNPSIQWEETFSWNAGVDLRVLNDRASVSVDVYNRKTTNLIASNIPLPLATGYREITDNIGDIKNSGVELSLSMDLIKSKSFFWRLSGNWSRNRNTFVKSFFPQVASGDNFLLNEVGREYNSFFLPVWAGVNSANGRPMWLDSTGKASEDYYSAKRQFVGKAQPDGFGSIINTFAWKGISLSVSVYYSYGSSIYYNSGTSIQNDGLRPFINQSKVALDRWRKPGDKASNPRRLIDGRAGTEVDMGTLPSTRYLFDGDYLRLSNVYVAYTFPNATMRNLHVNGLKVFLQGHNLATLTRYSGRDPESVTIFGTGNFIYPQQKSYTVGLEVNF